MGERTLYFLFTDTGTNLSRMINFFTQESLNHVSIAFDKEMSRVYSFGRKRPQNPFIGGFVSEEIHGDFLRNSRCAVYTMRATDAQYESIIKKIKMIEDKKDDYKYNFLGLLGILFRVEIERKDAYFCSQFIATIMEDTGLLELSQPYCFVTPSDIRDQEGMQLIYEGILGNYEPSNKKEASIDIPAVERPSFIFSVSKRVKQFVTR